jgi:catalase
VILRNILSPEREAQTHRTADAAQGSFTTNQGVVVADNQNTLKSRRRGPSLLEDIAFRERIVGGFAVKFYTDEGNFEAQASIGQCIVGAKQHRVWDREGRPSDSEA